MVSDNRKDPPELKEYNFSSSSTATVQASPNANTYLCAYYESSRRYCIYQGAGNSLYIVERPGGTGMKSPLQDFRSILLILPSSLKDQQHRQCQA